MNNTRKNSPEELIPDTAAYYIKDGKQIRKGTVASAIINAEILESAKTTIDEKNNTIKMLEELAPALCDFGFNKHFIWKNPAIQCIFDNINRRDKT